MTQDDVARELLLNSYYVAVSRIRRALSGDLSIRNSRVGESPPDFPGEVVGLCGQSGRHPYFRIALHDLEQALSRIERIRTRVVGFVAQTDELSAICSMLRRNTHFDAGTGCVNDRMPALVPLLPPEEIWYAGFELPLDLWRLISFDYDLVASAISVEAESVDFQFGALNRDALIFRMLLKRLKGRRVSFEIRREDLGAPWSKLLVSNLVKTVSLARIFFEAGSLLTPLSPVEVVRFYAGLRYAHWISDATGQLRVRREFDIDSVDARYKGVFAEEMSIGLMSVVLSDVFNARPINNTSEVVPRALTAGRPTADFIAQTTNPETNAPVTMIVESKGSLKRRVSAARRQKAKKQVSLTPVVVAGAPERIELALASTLYFEGQRVSTHCLVMDPPTETRGAFEIDPEWAWRVAYAKIFRMVGLQSVARQVAHGEPAESLRPVDLDREIGGKDERRPDERDRLRWHRAAIARQLFLAELVLDVGEGALAVDSAVLRVLREGIRRGSHRELAKLLGSRGGDRREGHRSFFTSVGVGIVFYEEVDGLI